MREKRQHQRAEFVEPVIVTVDGGESLQAEAQDISIGGMFLRAETAPPIGQAVIIVASLPGLKEANLPGFVRWTKGEGFGVQFGLLGVRETRAIGLMVRASRPE